MTNDPEKSRGRSSLPKKKTSGVTILLAVLGGGVLLVLLGIGISIYLVMSSEKGRAIVGMVGEGVKISSKAIKAPGTKELRAMGCKQAMVMDAADLARLGSYLDASAFAQTTGPDGYGEMVFCSGSTTPIACDRVAATYVGVVGPRPRSFVVSVQQTGKGGPGCSNLYDAQSNLIKPMGNTTLPTPVPTDTEE